jgi:hypothetical protein
MRMLEESLRRLQTDHVPGESNETNLAPLFGIQ